MIAHTRNRLACRPRREYRSANRLDFPDRRTGLTLLREPAGGGLSGITVNHHMTPRDISTYHPLAADHSVVSEALTCGGVKAHPAEFALGGRASCQRIAAARGGGRWSSVVAANLVDLRWVARGIGSAPYR